MDRPLSPPREPGTRRWSPARVAIGVAVAGLAVMWAYVLYLAVGPGRQPPIDRLEDPTFARTAESRCAEALARVEQLPPAAESPSAEARADVVDEANDIWSRLVEELAALAPAGDDDGRYVAAWLEDWRLYLGDRERYAAALHRDPEARFTVSRKPGEGRHVTGWIDQFAHANDMPSCATPPDV